MDEVEKKARAILAAEYEKNDMGYIAAQIRDSSWIHKADRIPLAAIAAALAERDQLCAEKKEFAAEAVKWSREVGHLKAEKEHYLGEALRWSTEAVRLQALLHDAQRDAERLRFAFIADGFVNLPKDRNDYAMDCAEEAGRDEPNAEDELNGVRRLIDAAMDAEREGQG